MLSSLQTRFFIRSNFAIKEEDKFGKVVDPLGRTKYCGILSPITKTTYSSIKGGSVFYLVFKVGMIHRRESARNSAMDLSLGIHTISMVSIPNKRPAVLKCNPNLLCLFHFLLRPLVAGMHN